MRLVVDLTLPTEVRLIARTRRIFRDYMEELGVDQDDAHDVVLALDEACTNVIRHAFPSGDDCFRLQAELSDGEVVVVVEDDGVGLAPEAAEGTRLGLQIVRSLIEELGGTFSLTSQAGTRAEVQVPAEALGSPGEKTG